MEMEARPSGAAGLCMLSKAQLDPRKAGLIPRILHTSQVGWGQVACEGFTDNARQSRHGMEAWLAPKLSTHSFNPNS